MMAPKRACVVGAGLSGVAALKECVRQEFSPVCYELDSDVGGTWRRKDYSQPTNTPAVYDNLITNTTKFNNCYSDFPPLPEDTPCQTPEAVQSYYRRVVDHFGLAKYIHFNTRVIKVRKTKDHEVTGQWEVFTTQRGSDIAGCDLAGPRGEDPEILSRCHGEIFDVVLVCTGYFKLPSYPTVDGLDSFKGTMQHSFSYFTPKPYEGKNVLIVGNMISAVDIAGDISNYAKEVFLALGDGTWILPRCLGNIGGFDLKFPRSVIHASDGVVQINDTLIREAEERLDHKGLGIRPAKPPIYSSFGLSDDLPLKIVSGKVKLYGRLVRVQGDKAYFQDGREISEIDSIVFCTGFRPDLSFLEMEIIQENGKMDLYKMTFPLNQKHNTLALIGHVTGDGTATVVFETQARLATLVMAGKHRLPSRDKMKADADFWNASTLARRGGYHSYFIPATLLAEMIAEEVGFYPTFWKVFLKDPILAFRNWYGPFYSAQYRLIGPDSQWDAASKTCYASYEEGYSSLRHMDGKELHRADIHAINKTRVIKFFAFASATAVVACLYYKHYGRFTYFFSLTSVAFKIRV